ncbi:GNAT family N-acetyltransferase [Serratia proteamaculans]|uniref:GNAT family N-acetyltransferase n=1 Tax=Serratia proteamaculans TaxID=28151 RepID=UPI0021BA609C|nr:GNAT family N-acetyltransferase [Serratia proteamaculans]
MTLPFTTERLQLRRFTPADFDAYAAYHRLPEVYRYLYAPTPDEAQLASQLARAVASRFSEDGDTLYCAVTLEDSGELIGEVLLKLANLCRTAGGNWLYLQPSLRGKRLCRRGREVGTGTRIRRNGLSPHICPP